jgi:hypothetical protein
MWRTEMRLISIKYDLLPTLVQGDGQLTGGLTCYYRAKRGWQSLSVYGGEVEAAGPIWSKEEESGKYTWQLTVSEIHSFVTAAVEEFLKWRAQDS